MGLQVEANGTTSRSSLIFTLSYILFLNLESCFCTPCTQSRRSKVGRRCVEISSKEQKSLLCIRYLQWPTFVELRNNIKCWYFQFSSVVFQRSGKSFVQLIRILLTLMGLLIKIQHRVGNSTLYTQARKCPIVFSLTTGYSYHDQSFLLQC